MSVQVQPDTEQTSSTGKQASKTDSKTAATIRIANASSALAAFPAFRISYPHALSFKSPSIAIRTRLGRNAIVAADYRVC